MKHLASGLVVHNPKYKSDNKYHSLLFNDNVFIREICVSDTLEECYIKVTKYMTDYDNNLYPTPLIIEIKNSP